MYHFGIIKWRKYISEGKTKVTTVIKLSEQTHQVGSQRWWCFIMIHHKCKTCSLFLALRQTALIKYTLFIFPNGCNAYRSVFKNRKRATRGEIECPLYTIPFESLDWLKALTVFGCCRIHDIIALGFSVIPGELRQLYSRTRGRRGTITLPDFES